MGGTRGYIIPINRQRLKNGCQSQACVTRYVSLTVHLTIFSSHCVGTFTLAFKTEYFVWLLDLLLDGKKRAK